MDVIGSVSKHLAPTKKSNLIGRLSAKGSTNKIVEAKEMINKGVRLALMGSDG
jgi:hypothetical protein